jgi:cytochrome c-type biogenesis protein CcmF
VAVAALLRGEISEAWMAPLRKWTMIAWGFLTVGITLGAWWAYAVLGWGGYWAWDPVENASFLPWLTATPRSTRRCSRSARASSRAGPSP